MHSHTTKIVFASREGATLWHNLSLLFSSKKYRFITGSIAAVVPAIIEVELVGAMAIVTAKSVSGNFFLQIHPTLGGILSFFKIFAGLPISEPWKGIASFFLTQFTTCFYRKIIDIFIQLIRKCKVFFTLKHNIVFYQCMMITACTKSDGTIFSVGNFCIRN